MTVRGRADGGDGGGVERGNTIYGAWSGGRAASGAHQLQPEDSVDEAVRRVRKVAQIDADASGAAVRRAERLVHGREPPQRRRRRRALPAGVEDNLPDARRPRDALREHGCVRCQGQGRLWTALVDWTCQSWPARRNGAERTASPGPAASMAAPSSSTVMDSVIGSANL